MKTIIRFSALVLISALTTFYCLNRVKPVVEIRVPPVLIASVEAPLAQIIPVFFRKPRQVPPVLERKALSELAPRLDDVRYEVRKKPEMAPGSLLLFASAIGKRFQIALLSQANATGFFEDLNSCLDETKPIAKTAKALCLKEGERLTHYYPVLQGNYDALALRASPEVRNLAFHRAVSNQ
jgi:hypothetical protein